MTPHGVRVYLLALLVGLLAQGLGSLVFRLVPAWADGSPFLLRGLLGIDIAHAWVHIVWGAAGTALLITRVTAAIPLATGFGAFYTAFGILGVAAHHPWGLELDLPENLFHLVVGPLTLLIGLAARRRHRDREPTSRAGGV